MRLRPFSPPVFFACLFAAATARADIDIDIEGVDNGVQQNILAYLSLARYRERDLEADVIERLHNRVAREVAAALRPFGYYDPKVESSLTRASGRGDWRVDIQVDPGLPIIVQNVDVQVSGPGANDDLFRRIMDNLPIRQGDRLNHAAYEQVKGDLQRTAATYGYLDSKLTRSELLVDPERREANIVLSLETGPRYRFGTTTIEQDVIDHTLVRRFMRYEQDEPFDVTELLRTQFALDDSQYFSSVEVQPGEPDRTERVVPVSIRATPNRRDRYQFGLGYGTDSGLRGTIQWDNRRVNRNGHRFGTLLEGAETRQRVQARYNIPIGDPALEKLALELSGERLQDLGDLDTEDISLTPSITQVWFRRFQRVLSLTIAQTATDTPTASPTGEVITLRDEDFLIVPSISVASIPQGYLGEALFSRGFFAELRGSSATLGADESFMQVRLEGQRVFDITDHWHLLLRGEVAGSIVGELSELPGTYRFFAGGDNSVRGFGYNDLSPAQEQLVRDEETGDFVMRSVLVGGKHMVTGTFEVIRDLPRNLGIAVFFDFGNAFDEFGKSPDPNDPDFLEYSAGIGFRYRLPVVTVGVDVAQPLSEPGAGPRFHINFSPKL
jgi:translocation and assembly module TamA